MSESWPGRQSGFSDMQLWQQRLMYRQLQELQRQQKLQQLDQEANKQNSSDQFSGVAKQAAAVHSPLVVNGMPIHDISNYTLKNEHMGSEPKTTSSAQMFVVGNMNWAQRRGTMPTQDFPNGLVFLQNQGQALRSMGLVSQRADQSLYGTPVSSNNNILNQYSQFPGVSNNGADMIAKFDGNQAEKQLIQSGVFSSFPSEQCVLPEKVMHDGLATRQISLEKSMFRQVAAPNINNGIMLENIPQLNPLGRSMQALEFQGRREQMDWSGNLQEKTVPQVEPFHGISNLDPTEQKLLFGTDDESSWPESSERIGNIGSGGYLHRNLPEGNDYFNAFPSIQSGSWSALMQSAVAEASSSDTGLQDEWSGLTFQQKEPSSGNHSAMFVDSGKQQTSWAEKFQSASSSTSRPFPLSDDTEVSTKDNTAARFCQSYMRSAYDHGQRVDAEASTSCQLDRNQLHQKVLESVVQAQMHSGGISSDARIGQSYEQPLSTIPAESKLNQHSLCGTWANRQDMLLHDGSRSHDKVNPRNVSELLPSGQGAVLKADDLETPVHCFWMNRPYVQRNQEGNMWKDDEGQTSVSFPHPTGGFSTRTSGTGNPHVQMGDPCVGGFVSVNLNSSNQERHEESVSGRQATYHGKLASVDSSLESKGNEDVDKHRLQVGKDHVVWGSSVNLFDRALGVAYDKVMENSSQKEVSDGDHISDNSHSAQPNGSGGIRRENSLLSGNDSSQSGSGNKRSSHQIGRKNSGSHRYLFHPMERLGLDVEHDTLKQNSWGQSQIVMCGMKNQEEPGLTGQVQFGGRSVSSSRMDLDKRQWLDSRRDVNASDGIDCRGRIAVYDSDIPSSFEGSTTNISQNKSGQTSQNMLELLHKVDQSRDSSTVSHSDFSNQDMVPERPDITACDMPSYLQHSQPSVLQGIDLCLPLEHQSILDDPLSSQAVHHYTKHFDLEGEGKNQICITSSVAVCPLPPLHVIPERETCDIRSNLSGLPNKGTSQSNVQVFSPGTSASRLPLARNQLQQRQQQQQWQQQQQSSIASGCVQSVKSVNMHCGNEVDQDAHNKSPLQIREFTNQHGGALCPEAVADQSGQQLLSAVSQIHPFKLACSSDGYSPVMPHTYTCDSGQPQVMGSTPFLRSSSQLPGQKTQSVSQSSKIPVMPQQGGFSAMLQNVWANLSMQQHLSGNLPSNVRPSSFQSVGTSSLDTKSWTSQMPNDQGRQTASKVASSSINSQQLTYEEQEAGKGSSLRQNPPQKVDVAPRMSSVLQLQEPLSQRASGGTSSVSILPMVHLSQQDIGRTNFGHGSSPDKQTSHTSLLHMASSSHQIGALHHNLKSSDVQNENYSLLQQIQAMKAAEADRSKHYDKRFKGGYSAAHAHHMTEKMPQNFAYGYNTVSKGPLDSELCATGHQNSFPSDTKMLCFSLDSNENQNMVRASQLTGSDFHSQGPTGAGLNSPHDYSSSLSKTSMPPSVVVSQPKQIDPQMAPSWFEQYGKFKNGETLAMYNGLAGSQKTVNAAVQRYLFSKTSESIGVPSPMEQGNDSVQVRSFWHSSSTTTANEQSSSLRHAPVDDIDHTLVPRTKKRKTASSELLPWHKEITNGSDRLRNISMAEMRWAQATKRLSDKVENEAKMIGDGSPVPRARRRLTLTTRLMQQLVPALPMRILAADVTLGYESVAYCIARLALGDACGRISCSISDFCYPPISRNMVSEKFKITEGVGLDLFSKVAEDFVGRVSKLENDLPRLEKKASILDVRIECQDLERFSIMNRFAKFHGRNQAEGVDDSSTSEAASWKLFLQTYVTALSMPGNPPEGVICVSL